MEIKKYLFKNQYNNQKENIVNKMFKRNQKNNIKRDSIFNHKLESSNSQFTQQNIRKNNIFLNNKTNSSNNIINTSSIFNSYHKSQSTDKKSLNKKKSNRTLNSRNLSQANKISLNNKILTSTNNTITASLTSNQFINYNKCITDRYYEENKIKYININKLGNNKIIGKSKTLLNKDFKDINYLSTTASIPKKSFVGIKKDKINVSNNVNIGKNIIKSKLSNKEAKYQLNYNDNNKTNNNIMNENILFKKKISNFKNANSNIKKSNKNKMKNQNMNNLINKKKINNLLNIKKLNLSNLPINFFEGKIIQGIMSLNTNNINNTNNTNIANHTDSTCKKECYTDRTNYNYLNNINSQIKTKEIINEQYNNINNNYIIANIINNIKYNNNKPEKKKISRNKSIKLSERKNTVNNTNLTSLNILLKNSTLRNYPSSLRIKTIDISRMNNKTPSIEYNLSFNKKHVLESKNMNKRLFDANNNLNVNYNKKNISTKRKNCNIKFKKKGKNYKKLINVPLKLTKKNIFHKENKLNIEMNYSNNVAGFDKLNLLTFNYIHSLNTNHKTEYSNKRKLSQGNNSDRYKNIFQLINNKNNINDSKRNSHNAYKIDNMSKTNLIHNIPRQSFTKQSKYINSLSNYEISSREKEKNKNSTNAKTENLNNINNAKLRETVSNQKLNTKKPHSNSPLDMNCLIKKKYSKKNKNSNHSKSRNRNRIYKNYVGFLNNESKTNISKYNTNKSSQNKKETNELNNHLDGKVCNNNINKINSKKRMKNLSVALDNNINKSIKTDFDNVIKDNEKQIKYSFKDIFSKNKCNTNSNNIKNEENINIMNTDNEYKLISVKKNSKNNKNQIIQKANSIKNKNQSEFSKKSININNSISEEKNKTKIKEDNKNKEKDKDKDKDRQILIIEEYFDEILYSLLKEESEFISNKMIDYNYLLNTESEITPEMRAMVVDWLMEVHQIFHFQEKCLFTTIQLMDKYLSKKLISIDQFQLLALTSLNIASKQEEVEYPILDNFITISKNTITKEEMIDMENDLISIIQFEILSPTVLDFFQIYAAICNLNPVEVSQGLYIMNILLIDINMLKYKNSILAFAVLKLITKEENINKVILFIDDINKKAYKINGNKNNEAQILVEEINKENNSNEIGVEIKYLFRTILKTHYHNAKNKFNSQAFHAVSSYTSI